MNKKDLKDFQKIIIVFAIISVMFAIVALVQTIKLKKCDYTFIINGKAYKSSDCYTQDQMTYCKERSEYKLVDMYYTTK